MHLARPSGMQAQRVRTGVWCLHAHLAVPIDEADQGDGHVEDVARGLRDPVIALLARRIEQPEAPQNRDTLRVARRDGRWPVQRMHRGRKQVKTQGDLKETQ